MGVAAPRHYEVKLCTRLAHILASADHWNPEKTYQLGSYLQNFIKLRVQIRVT